MTISYPLAVPSRNPKTFTLKSRNVVGINTAPGSLVAQRNDRSARSAVLALSAGLLCLAATGQALGSTELFLGCAVLAMGAINNVFSKNGQVALGVTYMTGALVRIGEGLAAWLNGTRGKSGALPSLLLWASLAGGGLTGALAFLHWQQQTPWIACGWALALVLAALLLDRSEGQSAS